MDEFWRLILLSLAMFIGCYAAGYIPLALTLSAGVLRRVTTFGAGLLIGTALIIIIPEGVESLYGKALHVHEHDAHPPITATESQPGDDLNGVEDAEHSLSQEVEEGYSQEQLQMIMGASLTVGFVFMLLVDHFGGGHAHSADVEGGSGGRHKRHKLTATIGLVVHAAADGLALGAAAGLSKADVEIIIFLAIMLHKAPAAFGLTSFLIHAGYDRFAAKRHLMVFSLAAPVAAFLSYFGLVRVMYIVHLPITGIAMLFSAGTFLYVSTVHVLNELMVNPHSDSTSPTLNGSTNGSGAAAGNSRLSHLELLLLVCGALVPLGFNVVHSH